MDYPTWNEVINSESYKKLDSDKQTVVRVGWMDTVRKNNPDMTKEQEVAIWNGTNPLQDKLKAGGKFAKE